MQRKVTLVHSSFYKNAVCLHPTNTLRYKLWEELARAYGLLTGSVRVVAPNIATDDHLMEFHSSEYISCIKQLEDSKNATDDSDGDDGIDLTEAAEFGLVDDCPVFKGLHQYMLAVVGGSLTAVDALLDGSADIAINWAGGRHHAKRGAASGFCYVNDVVLAILRFLDCPRVNRVLYIDIDVHHGDGVQEAFWDSSNVFTLSFHHHAQGFFPGTGHGSEQGEGEGNRKSLNVPLKAGIGDRAFCRVVAEVSRAVFGSFCPDIVVIQCGCDTLAHDRLGTFNLTTRGVTACVSDLLEQARPCPVLLLGGGGYHPPSVARCWTSLTALAAGVELSEDIPEHECYPEYRPDFALHSRPNPGRFDLNQPEDLDCTIQQAVSALQPPLTASDTLLSFPTPVSPARLPTPSPATTPTRPPSTTLLNPQSSVTPKQSSAADRSSVQAKRPRDEFEFGHSDDDDD